MTSAEGSTTPGRSFLTPVKRSAANAEAGPSRQPQAASPAYSSRRHSLYGIEDRVVIDAGSRTWKVGFSGETDPRAVFWANTPRAIWDLDLDSLSNIGTQEARRRVSARATRNLRKVFSKHLMTDAKSRKVIILENTYLPAFVKECIAEALFDNLKVPSISFTSSSLLSLTACGRITGLVVDCGWLETTITPVYYARPLFNLSRSTLLAGRKLHDWVRALLRQFAVYCPPPTSLDRLVPSPVQPVPESVLTDHLVERIVTETLFVGEVHLRAIAEEQMDVDAEIADEEAAKLDRLRGEYMASSTASDLEMLVGKSKASDLGPGKLVIPGWIRERAAEVLFVYDEDEETDSIQDCILQAILKMPVDLRPAMACTILVSGGTASLPGFIPRLRVSLKSALLPPPISPFADPPGPPAPLHSHVQRLQEAREWRRRNAEPYKELYGLLDQIAILNDPAPMYGDGSGGHSNAGIAPRWVPSLLSWVGGSLAGMLKTGAPELLREEYDMRLGESISRGEAYQAEQDVAEAEVAALVGIDVDSLRPGEALGIGKRRRGWREGVVLQDWSRGVLA